MKTSHAGPSVIDEIRDFNRDRDPKLVKLKFRRMAEDPFAFFRGADHLFGSQWAQFHPPDVGPSILICGDLHLENFGAYRADDGECYYDINDFDEALVAPCGLDLVRCTTSILLAAQLWKLTPVQAMRTVLAFLDRYRDSVAGFLKTKTIRGLTIESAHGPIRSLLRRPQGVGSQFHDHLLERTKSGDRRIERKSKRFRDVEPHQVETIRKAFESHVQHPDRLGPLKVVDVAFRVAGIGSLGLQRFAILVAIRNGASPYCLFDLKQVGPPALIGCAEEIQPFLGESDASRVVQAQNQLQYKATVGLQILEVAGQAYRLRELIPEENRTGLSELRKRSKLLRRAVAIAGRLTGAAHMRGCRINGEDRSDALGDWSAGPGLEAVIASAIRFADQTRRDYNAFRLYVRK